MMSKTSNMALMFAVAVLAGLLFYAAREHWGHIFGLAPYLLFLACPAMHLFMHHGHGHHNNHGDGGTPKP
ncbi:DUF2933 domain-containing protein [Sphingobium fuliginis]|uniref:DUF2933 domain-containing protein n=1 Tax=Sphingobium fuliginis (strain ATCC 27551) TaxID=336203 RepID=UPI00101E9B60|nr:DUF2933 domain-containing protein [Sphingobium fuliginis]RYL97631.1 DUF2933 domain-containing protein [Sphingobium fuliginis]